MNAERPLIALEAEHGVLGALMHKPELCETVGAFLSPMDFSNADHSTLYTLILGCHSKKVRPDSITLSELRSELPSGELTIVYASELMSNVPSAANGVAYARIVTERSRARKLHETGMALMELATKAGNLSNQVAEAQRMVFDLTVAEESPDVLSYRDALGDLFDEMQRRMDGTEQMGLEFGLPDLDKIVSGARPGNLVIIAGRPGTGKTVLGVGMAERTAVQMKKGALIFSLEMSAKELAKRTLSSLSGVGQDRIESGYAGSISDEKVRLEAAVAKMSGSDTRICDKGGLTFSRICSIARFQHRASPLSLIVVDYLSLIATDPAAKHVNRNQELGAYTRGFKALAKELGIPIIVLAQLNRSIESRADKKPVMSDLRDSGEIEQDADVIIMAHRDMATERGQNGITEIDVVKCRHAKPGFCLLQFQGALARFESCAQPREEEQVEQYQQPARKSARSMMSSFQGGRA